MVTLLHWAFLHHMVSDTLRHEMGHFFCFVCVWLCVFLFFDLFCRHSRSGENLICSGSNTLSVLKKVFSPILNLTYVQNWFLHVLPRKMQYNFISLQAFYVSFLDLLLDVLS